MARFDWIRFDPDGSGGGGNDGVVDEFDGTTLGADWERIRGDQSAVVSGGTLQIPAQTGDIYQTRNDARNLVVRTAPSGAWVATAKLNFEGTAQYHQAGIMVYGDDDNFTKFGRIAHTRGRRREVRVHLRGQRGRAQRGRRLDGQHPDGLPGRLLRPADVRRDERGRPLLDRRDHLDPGRAPGADPGQRQDRPVRLLQRRRRQPGRGLRLASRSPARARRRRRRYAVRPELRRPVRRRDARQDALERDRPRHARAVQPGRRRAAGSRSARATSTRATPPRRRTTSSCRTPRTRARTG